MFTSGFYWLAVAAVIAVAIAVLFIIPARRRRHLARMPLPPQWQDWLEEAVPYYRWLPREFQDQLQQHLKVFVAEKTFYGCDGLEIEDRHRVTIAAQASLLLMGRSVDEFDAVQAILLYPAAFRVPPGPGWGTDETGVVTEQDDIHLGESWEEGRIILSWADVETEIAQHQAGLVAQTSVVVHEFAHQLDQTEGISAAMSGTDQGPGRILKRAFDELQQAVDAGNEDMLIDPYGATNPQEFVAVAAETFFLEPDYLRHSDPELYGVLRRLFRIDLAACLTGQAADHPRPG